MKTASHRKKIFFDSNIAFMQTSETKIWSSAHTLRHRWRKGHTESYYHHAALPGRGAAGEFLMFCIFLHCVIPIRQEGMLQWVPHVIEKHPKVPAGLHILLKGRHAHLCIRAQRPKSLGGSGAGLQERSVHRCLQRKTPTGSSLVTRMSSN